MAKKFYVVWKGKKTGVFKKWSECKKQIDGFQGAQYKSFADEKLANKAAKESYEKYKGKTTNKKILSKEERLAFGNPNLNTISVDAACSGNPGAMEYRGVETASKKELFKIGPFKQGTNNIGEFLALVHGIAYLKGKKLNTPIYSDSKIAMNWVKLKQCKTKLTSTKENTDIFDMMRRAEKWLRENEYNNPILKWETKAWGEIPADFGRK